jgi:hypothetical protein
MAQGHLQITISAQVQPLIDAFRQMAVAGEAVALSLAAMGDSFKVLTREMALSYRAEIYRRTGTRPVLFALRRIAKWERAAIWHPRVIGLWIRSQYDLLPVEW